MVKSLNQKQLTIEHSALKRMVYSARKFLVQKRTGNVIAESIKELDIKELFVINVE